VSKAWKPQFRSFWLSLARAEAAVEHSSQALPGKAAAPRFSSAAGGAAGAGAGAGIGISIPPRKMASARGLLGADRDGERDSLLDDNGGSETRRSRSDER
jgi:hypothetical protein